MAGSFFLTLSSLEVKIDSVQIAVSDHGSRITSLESNADLLSERIHAMEATCKTLTENYDKLRAKTTDLEGHSIVACRSQSMTTTAQKSWNNVPNTAM